MSSKSLRRASVGVAFAALALGGSGAAYAGTQRATALATDVIVATGSDTQLPGTAGTMTVVASIRLPAGAWVLSGTGSLVDYGTSDYSRCQIAVGNRVVATTVVVVGNPALAGNAGPSTTAASFALTGGLSITAPTTAALRCGHDATVGLAAYVTAGTTLQVHKTDSLQVVGA